MGQARRIICLGGAQPSLDQLDVGLRRRYASFRFFLKNMKYIDRSNKADRIYGAVGVTIEIFDYFEDATSAKPPQRLG